MSDVAGGVGSPPRRCSPAQLRPACKTLSLSQYDLEAPKYGAELISE